MILLIFVGDDQPEIELLFCQQFRHDLRSGRFMLEFVPSAQAALQRLSDATAMSPILVISNMNIPGMSGLELLAKAKAARPNVPVVMVSAHGDMEITRKVLLAGADGLLTKPIDFRALRSEIEVLAKRAA